MLTIVGGTLTRAKKIQTLLPAKSKQQLAEESPAHICTLNIECTEEELYFFVCPKAWDFKRVCRLLGHDTGNLSDAQAMYLCKTKTNGNNLKLEHIIWLREFNAGTLAHEIHHFIQRLQAFHHIQDPEQTATIVDLITKNLTNTYERRKQ